MSCIFFLLYLFEIRDDILRVLYQNIYYADHAYKVQRLFLRLVKYGYKSLLRQPYRGVLKNRCSENIQQIYRRIPMPKIDLIKVAIK